VQRFLERGCVFHSADALNDLAKHQHARERIVVFDKPPHEVTHTGAA
jgi:hypothetical protein